MIHLKYSEWNSNFTTMTNFIPCFNYDSDYLARFNGKTEFSYLFIFLTVTIFTVTPMRKTVDAGS